MSTIAEIFDKDPLSYTKTDITETVEYFRKMRLNFKMGDKTAGNPKKIIGSTKGSVDLKDLKLDI